MKPAKSVGDQFLPAGWEKGIYSEREGFQVGDTWHHEKQILIKGLTYVKPEDLLAFVEWYYGGKIKPVVRDETDEGFLFPE